MSDQSSAEFLADPIDPVFVDAQALADLSSVFALLRLELAIVRKIVNQRHRSIEVESQLGQGITFRVILLVAPGSSERLNDLLGNLILGLSYWCNSIVPT